MLRGVAAAQEEAAMQGERIDKRVIYLYDSLRNRYEKKLEKPVEAPLGLVKSHAEAAKRLSISTSAELAAIDNRVEELSKRRDPVSSSERSRSYLANL